MSPEVLAVIEELYTEPTTREFELALRLLELVDQWVDRTPLHCAYTTFDQGIVACHQEQVKKHLAKLKTQST